MFSRRNLIFLLIISLALFLSLTIVIKRAIIESNNNNVEIGIDYQKFERIFYSEGNDVYLGCKILLKSGINTVLLHEDTLATLSNSGHITVLSGNEMLRMFRASAIINPLLVKFIESRGISPHFTYVLTTDAKLHDRILNELKIRLKDDELKINIISENISVESNASKDALYLISINSSIEDIQNTGMGFSPDNLSRLQEMGFSIVLGISNSNFITVNQIDRLMEKIQSVKNLSGVMIEGGVVPGFTESSADTMEYFGKKLAELSKIKSKFVLFEFEKVVGLKNINFNIKQMTVKGHRLSSTETRPPLTLDEHNAAIDRYVRAIRERNVKMAIVEGFTTKLRGIQISLLMQNFNFLDALVKKVKENGYNIKSSSALESDMCSPIIIIIISWGIIALYIMFLEYTIGMPRKVSYLVLTVFMAFSLVFVLKWYNSYIMTIYRQFFSFAIALIIPLIPVLYKVKADRSMQKFFDFYPVFYRSIFILLYNIFFVALLSCLIIGMMSSTEFINGVETFAGVKLAFLAPILVTFAIISRNERLYVKFKDWLGGPVKIYHALTVLLIIFIARQYFLYQGDPFDFKAVSYRYEEYFNWLFGKVIGIQPLFQEYAVGYPALILYFYLNHRGVSAFNILLTAAGVMGPVSLVNSICHIHVPIYLTALKSLGGLFVGILAGAVLCSVAEFISSFYRTGEGEAKID